MDNWEQLILQESPVERVKDIMIKREDKFAPLGYGNINGSKLRVCIWLIGTAVKNGAKGVIHGAVTGSPQHPMVATICKMFGIPCIDVIGTTDIDEHPNLVIAKKMGAEFVYSKVGYAKTLQAQAYKIRDEKHPDYFVLETNITVQEDRNSPERIRDFHSVGAAQAANLPESTETLILPAGSCNSCVGALYGVANRFEKSELTNLNEIVLMGIGNFGSKDPAFITRRLGLISPDSTRFFNVPWQDDFFNSIAPVKVRHYDLNGSGFCEYKDLMPYTYGDVVMHPRYEGKIFNYMEKHSGEFEPYMNPSTVFWIVGGAVNA